MDRHEQRENKEADSTGLSICYIWRDGKRYSLGPAGQMIPAPVMPEKKYTVDQAAGPQMEVKNG